MINTAIMLEFLLNNPFFMIKYFFLIKQIYCYALRKFKTSFVKLIPLIKENAKKSNLQVMSYLKIKCTMMRLCAMNTL